MNTATSLALQFTKNHYAIYKNILRRDFNIVLSLSTTQCDFGSISVASIMHAQALMPVDPLELLDAVHVHDFPNTNKCQTESTHNEQQRHIIDICKLTQQSHEAPMTFACLKQHFLIFQKIIDPIVQKVTFSQNIDIQELLALAKQLQGLEMPTHATI